MDRKKIYPMMTLCDEQGKMNWDYLKKCKEYLEVLKHNFRVLNVKDPTYKNLK